VRAHVPGAFWAFANSWRDIFHTGVCDHAIKELCRLYVSRSVTCEFCGNQRSIKAATKSDRPVVEEQVRDLLNFEKSTRYTDREKAAHVRFPPDRAAEAAVVVLGADGDLERLAGEVDAVGLVELDGGAVHLLEPGDRHRQTPDLSGSRRPRGQDDSSKDAAFRRRGDRSGNRADPPALDDRFLVDEMSTSDRRRRQYANRTATDSPSGRRPWPAGPCRGNSR
jgi:hypothetical protein